MQRLECFDPINMPINPSVIACYFNFIISIAIFFTTSLAILAYKMSMAIRQAYSNILLLNLLINAIVISINSMIFFGYGAIMGNSNILSIQWVCSLNGFFNVFCCGMEIYTLMCIALERYFAIVKQYPLTLKQIMGLLVFGWIECGLVARLNRFIRNNHFLVSHCGIHHSITQRKIPLYIALIHSMIKVNEYRA